MGIKLFDEFRTADDQLLLPIKHSEKFAMFRIIDGQNPQNLQDEYFIAKLEKKRDDYFGETLFLQGEDPLKAGKFISGKEAFTVYDRLNSPLTMDAEVREQFEKRLIR